MSGTQFSFEKPSVTAHDPIFNVVSVLCIFVFKTNDTSKSSDVSVMELGGPKVKRCQVLDHVQWN